MPNDQTQHTTEMGGQRAEAAEHESSWREQARQYASQGTGYLRQGYDGAYSTLREYPMSTVLMGFGLGLGVGLLLGSMMGEPPRRRRWYELDIDTSNVEQFGRRVLDAIADALPDSVSRRITG